MPNYFEFDYINLTHGFIYLFANYFIAMGAPIAMGDFAMKPRWKCALILIAEMICCTVVMELLAALYFTIFNSDWLVAFVCGAIVAVLYALIRCKNKPAVRIMRASTYIGLSCVALTMTMSMGALLGTPYYYLQWLLIALNGIMIFSTAFFSRFLSIKDEMHCPSLFVFAIVGIGVIYMVFAMLRRELDFDAAASIAICGILMFVYLLVYYLIGYAVRKSYDNEYERTRRLMRDADKDALRLSNENIENLHKLRHDLKNHYAVMKTFIEDGNYTGLEKYFSEFAENIETTVGFSDCGNDTLNAIIGIEHGRLSDMGATLKCSIAVPSKLEMNDVDLCSLIMNLIDNAAEYYERSMPNKEGGNEILLEVVLTNKTLVITVANDILPEHVDRALSLKTSKTDKSNHGFGSKIVASIVEKYNGNIDYEVQGGKFTVSAMLFCE